MSSHLNGNDGDQGGGPDNDKVVPLPTLAERDRMRREKEEIERRLHQARTPKEALFNIPPVTSSLLALIVAIHILLNLVLSPLAADDIIMNFGFIPAYFSGENPTPLLAWLTPITHMFLHGSWHHIAMNGFMLLAFGSGIERWLGSKRMLILFFGSGLFGVLAHYILNTSSEFPMIGASGGLSGFFAAAIVMLNRGQQEMGGRLGILPFALIWIGLSIGFGMMGGPGGSMIAWAAHVGGFLGGFAVIKLMRA